MLEEKKREREKNSNKCSKHSKLGEKWESLAGLIIYLSSETKGVFVSSKTVSVPEERVFRQDRCVLDSGSDNRHLLFLRVCLQIEACPDRAVAC